MKILVVQLARLGDIIQTWPTVFALRRKYPEAVIDFAVRKRYRSAIDMHSEVNNVIALDTSEVLAPMLFQVDGYDLAAVALNKFIEPLQNKYDLIINLSFSPFSSYLVSALSNERTVVRGYTRASDGYLSIPDDSSAYFYAQVGFDRSNRLHLFEIFSLVAGVDLVATDFRGPNTDQFNWDAHRIVIHVGGSQREKVCPEPTWQQIIENLSQIYSGTIYLVGTANEKLKSEVHLPNVTDLCGKTSLHDLFSICENAEAVIACDSMVMQIASLTKTKTLNISFPAVRFWETGPRTPKSRVLVFNSNFEVDVEQVIAGTKALISNNDFNNGYISTSDAENTYIGPTEDDVYEFQWALIKAIYMGKEFPGTDRELILSAFQRLHEVAVLGLDQTESILNNKNASIAASILDQVDLLLENIAGFCPHVAPLTRWFLCEKSRILPGSTHAIAKSTQFLFEQLFEVTRLYTLSNDMLNQTDGRTLTWK